MEGFSASAYIDTEGTAIIGYGQPEITGKFVVMGDIISQPEAEVYDY
ncbi:MAG: hypothetical protein QNJ53_25805 [Pleurocapsa sp. MO_192.B19]|nr:hypothetical protein [Pleurocapsa sp. MO_192.B19]